jgi:5-formyltetrahydrofolate cyclo-ligase
MADHASDNPAKAEIRSAVKERLADMTADERHSASDAACVRVISLDAFRHASVVMLYMPLAYEVDTTSIAIRSFQLGKTVCVPRVDWARQDMHAVEITTFDDRVMQTDAHGIRTPRDGRLLIPGSIDLVVVPGLAFDARGNRLGRGGGFYDRFLTRLHKSATSVGLVFDEQIIDDVPVDDRDIGVDFVVTDRRITRARTSRSRN